MKILLLLTMLFGALFAKVNINTATMDELHSLKGIGHTKATAIIEYRKEHKFEKKEDIVKVKGIGEKLFEKIEDDIEVK